MSYGNPNTDLFSEQPKRLSSTLNVLTILTFIGCGIAYLGTLYNIYKMGSYENDKLLIEKRLDQIGEDGFAGKMLKSSLEIMEKSYQYRYVLFIAGLVFTTFCLIGAIQMRKQKKSGLPLYIIGELAPVLLTAVLVSFTSIPIIISGVISLAFVILYANQSKNLIYN